MVKRISVPYQIKDNCLCPPDVVDSKQGRRWDEHYNMQSESVSMTVTEDVIADIEAHNRKVEAQIEGLSGKALKAKKSELIPIEYDGKYENKPKPGQPESRRDSK